MEPLQPLLLKVWPLKLLPQAGASGSGHDASGSVQELSVTPGRLISVENQYSVEYNHAGCVVPLANKWQLFAKAFRSDL